MTRLVDLKAAAQDHYSDPLQWTDLTPFGGSAWADVDHHTVSVMVNPPAGNAQIVVIRDGRQEPLVDAPQMDAVPLSQAYQMAMKL